MNILKATILATLILNLSVSYAEQARVPVKDTQGKETTNVFKALAELKSSTIDYESSPQYKDGTDFEIIIKDLISKKIDAVTDGKTKILIKDPVNNGNYVMAYKFLNGKYVAPKGLMISVPK